MASLVFDHEDAEEKLLAQALFVNDVDLGDEDDLLVRWSQSKVIFPQKNLSNIPVCLYFHIPQKSQAVTNEVQQSYHTYFRHD